MPLIIEQLFYTNIAGYHADNASNNLQHDPIFTDILDKDTLALQPTISRCINRLKKYHIDYFNEIFRYVCKKSNHPKKMKHIVLNIDSTHVEIFGK